jgi:succinate dehydrogenase / fumarate reductase flavoprotein subunit
MYEKITDVDPYKEPMQIYPAIHYSMGGTWVDYNLMTTVPGLYAFGEDNLSDHGGNRLGASALMQGLADGYFVLPYTIGDYLADEIQTPRIDVNHPEFDKKEKAVTERLQRLFNVKGSKSVDSFHKRLGNIMWDYVGMARNEEGLKYAIAEIAKIKEDFYNDVRIPGDFDAMNIELEKAGRVADFIELGDLMARDALNRNESCGGHYREESVTEEGEAKRDDDNFTYVSAWEYKGENQEPVLHKEDLVFETVELTQRSYK